MQNSATKPYWLSAADIEQINTIVVSKTGETHALISPDLLDSAVARPKNLFAYDGEIDIIVLGVRLIEAIGKNHCFEQGNKRTAFHAGLTFMERNGHYIDLPDTVENAELVTKVIIGEMPAGQLIDLFRRRQM